MSAMSEPHEILGVEPHADAKTLRKAYHQLIRKHKPEREPEKFKEIREAYETLKAQAAFQAQFRAASSKMGGQGASRRTPDKERVETEPIAGGPYENPLVQPPSSHKRAGSASPGAASVARFDRDGFQARLMRRDFRSSLGELRRGLEADPLMADEGLRRAFAVFASVTVWAAPELFDKLREEFSDVLADLERRERGSALLFRRAIADEWQEYCAEARPVSGLVDFMELLPLASGKTALELAERIALCARRDAAETSRSIDALFTNEGYEPSSLSSYFNDAIELLRWELEDLGVVPEQSETETETETETALAIIDADPPPAVKVHVDELLGLTRLDSFRWPAYAALAGIGTLIVGWPALLVVGGIVGLGFIPGMAKYTPSGMIERRWDDTLEQTCWASQLTYAELAAQVGYMQGPTAKRLKSWLDEERVDPLWDNYYRLLRVMQRRNDEKMLE